MEIYLSNRASDLSPFQKATSTVPKMQNQNAVIDHRQQDAVDAVKCLADLEIDLVIFGSESTRFGKAVPAVEDGRESLPPTIRVLRRIGVDVPIHLFRFPLRQTE